MAYTGCPSLLVVVNDRHIKHPIFSGRSDKIMDSIKSGFLMGYTDAVERNLINFSGADRKSLRGGLPFSEVGDFTASLIVAFSCPICMRNASFCCFWGVLFLPSVRAGSHGLRFLSLLLVRMALNLLSTRFGLARIEYSPLPSSDLIRAGVDIPRARLTSNAENSGRGNPASMKDLDLVVTHWFICDMEFSFIEKQKTSRPLITILGSIAVKEREVFDFAHTHEQKN